MMMWANPISDNCLSFDAIASPASNPRTQKQLWYLLQQRPSWWRRDVVNDICNDVRGSITYGEVIGGRELVVWALGCMEATHLLGLSRDRKQTTQTADPENNLNQFGRQMFFLPIFHGDGEWEELLSLGWTGDLAREEGLHNADLEPKHPNSDRLLSARTGVQLEDMIQYVPLWPLGSKRDMGVCDRSQSGLQKWEEDGAEKQCTQGNHDVMKTFLLNKMVSHPSCRGDRLGSVKPA